MCIYGLYILHTPVSICTHIVSLVGIVFRSRCSRPKRMHLGNSDPPIPQSWRNVLPPWRESPNMPLEHLSFHAHENLSSKSYPVCSKSPSRFWDIQTSAVALAPEAMKSNFLRRKTHSDLPPLFQNLPKESPWAITMSLGYKDLRWICKHFCQTFSENKLKLHILIHIGSWTLLAPIWGSKVENAITTLYPYLFSLLSQIHIFKGKLSSYICTKNNIRPNAAFHHAHEFVQKQMWIKDSASLFARKIRCYILKSCQLESHFLRRLSQWDSLTTSCFSTLAQFGLNVCLHSWHLASILKGGRNVKKREKKRCAIHIHTEHTHMSLSPPLSRTSTQAPNADGCGYAPKGRHGVGLLLARSWPTGRPPQA